MKQFLHLYYYSVLPLAVQEQGAETITNNMHSFALSRLKHYIYNILCIGGCDKKFLKRYHSEIKGVANKTELSNFVTSTYISSKKMIYIHFYC
jgi:hypothetical protein